MCSFIVTNYEVKNLEYINFFNQKRGPDFTNTTNVEGYYFLHNLLSITGDFTEQPFVNELNELVSIYNGEIYNYQEILPGAPSDGYCLNHAYAKKGPCFVKDLDGEFSVVVVDNKKRKITIATDPFATKPLWVAKQDGKICITSYESVLKRLGFKKPSKVKANTAYVINMDTLKVERKFQVKEFDISNQYKRTYDDWIRAFKNSIYKRSRNLRERIFIGLSSGYDSGSIACELMNQNIPFNAYSIVGDESKEIIDQRHQLLNAAGQKTEMIHMTQSQFDYAKATLKTNAEEFQYRIIRDGVLSPDEYMTDDQGAVGMAHICSKAQKEGIKVYFSGQGADEIFSDYGFQGERFYEHSSFGGFFPSDLSTVFPWNSFYESTQLSYLAKEEGVSGAYGIEGRYPFLDFNVVQEFLWLHPEFKNQYYKAPLHAYMTRNDFPFEVNKKIGFGCDKELIPD